jgi:hypothetical protein
LQAQAIQIAIPDADIHAVKGGVRALRLMHKLAQFFLGVDAQQTAQRQHAEHDADDAKRVGNGVAEGREAEPRRVLADGLFGWLRY